MLKDEKRTELGLTGTFLWHATLLNAVSWATHSHVRMTRCIVWSWRNWFYWYKKKKNHSRDKLGEDGGAGFRSGFTGLFENSSSCPSQDKLGCNPMLV